MISSIQNSTSNYYVNSLNASGQTNRASSAQSSAQSGEAAATPNRDTVSISAEGAAYVSQTSQTEETESLTSTLIDEESEETAETDLLSALEESEESEDEDASDDLSQYTDSELSELLSKGEITRAEYDAEMESRQVSAENQEAAGASLTDEA